MKKLSLLATLLASTLLVACGAANEESKPASSEAPASSAVAPESSVETPASSEAESPAEAAVLFSWTAAGTCTLDFYVDCTYKFAFPSYKVEEKGTWSFQSWSMKVTTPNGNEIAASIDGTTRDMVLEYVADINAQLKDTFTAASSVWGPKLGASGSYTPAA